MTCGISMLMGGGGTRITLNASYSPTSTVPGPSNPVCQFELSSAGDINMTTVNNTVNDVGDWLAPRSGMSNYDCMLTVNSGTSPTGSATATWLNLGTTRNWQLTRTVLGITSNNCTLQIRNSASGTVLGTATVIMTAERT